MLDTIMQRLVDAGTVALFSVDVHPRGLGITAEMRFPNGVPEGLKK